MYRRILVIEDEAILRRVIVRNLTSRGLTAYEAGSATEAVAVAQAKASWATVPSSPRSRRFAARPPP